MTVDTQALHTALDKWSAPENENSDLMSFTRVLDLACGSGEVTASDPSRRISISICAYCVPPPA